MLAGGRIYSGMAKPKLVNIGQDPELPTIREFFTEMSERQGEEIRRLKEEIGVAGPSNSKPRTRAKVSRKRPVPDPWQLHPVRRTKIASKKSAKKAAAKTSARKSPAKKKKAAKSTKRRG